MLCRLLVLLTLTSVLHGQVPSPQVAQPPSPSLSLLLEQLNAFAKEAGGVVGLGARHLPSGREVWIHPEQPFPMASVYKVAIAVQLLSRVDSGELSLEQMVSIQRGDLRPGSGMLAQLLDDPGVQLSLLNLLKAMLIISDNTASDALLRLAGGPQAVTERMRALGIQGLRVDRSTLQLIADWAGIEKLPTLQEAIPALFPKLFADVPPEKRQQAEKRFTADPRDTATPRAMVQLLAGLWQGKLLSPSSTQLLLDILFRCQTGPERIRGLLPPGTRVAHKTGTIGGITNDAGIIELPASRGALVVCAFIKGSEAPLAERERAIAQMARTLFDYFLFLP